MADTLDLGANPLKHRQIARAENQAGRIEFLERDPRADGHALTGQHSHFSRRDLECLRPLRQRQGDRYLVGGELTRLKLGSHSKVADEHKRALAIEQWHCGRHHAGTGRQLLDRLGPPRGQLDRIAGDRQRLRIEDVVIADLLHFGLGEDLFAQVDLEIEKTHFDPEGPARTS